MNTKLVNSAAGVINAALTQNRTAAGIALALDSAQLLMSPATARRLAELEAIEARLLAVLPTEPRPEYGLPNDLAASAAEYGAWQEVAEVLGVQLPYERPADQDPIAFALTAEAVALVETGGAS
jgi:hypothetical protein